MTIDFTSRQNATIVVLDNTPGPVNQYLILHDNHADFEKSLLDLFAFYRNPEFFDPEYLDTNITSTKIEIQPAFFDPETFSIYFSNTPEPHYSYSDATEFHDCLDNTFTENRKLFFFQ